MTTREVARPDPSPSPTLGESRGRVLRALQEADGPLGVRDVSGIVGLHPNTARFHLDALVEAGAVERSTEGRDQPGRPRMLYRARPGDGRGGQRSYRLLAEILTSYLAAETAQPAKAAERAGEAWGRYLAERPPPFQRVEAAAAAEQLMAALDKIGFAPEAVTTGRKRQVLLHQCPFRETAEAHQDVVCSIHLGLMRGFLDELDAPIQAERLDPFVEPSLCVTHLGPRSRSRQRG